MQFLFMIGIFVGSHLRLLGHEWRLEAWVCKGFGSKYSVLRCFCLHDGKNKTDKTIIQSMGKQKSKKNGQHSVYGGAL